MKEFAKIYSGEDCHLTLMDDDGYLFIRILDDCQHDIPGGYGVIILSPEGVEVLIKALEDFKAGLPTLKLKQRIQERYGTTEHPIQNWWLND